MTTDTMSLQEVYDALARIEGQFRQSTGKVDLLAMSRTTNLYTTWRELRERERRLKCGVLTAENTSKLTQK